MSDADGAYQDAKRNRLRTCTCPHQRISDMTGTDFAERTGVAEDCPAHGRPEVAIPRLMRERDEALQQRDACRASWEEVSGQRDEARRRAIRLEEQRDMALDERDESRAERDRLREALQAILEVPSHAFDMATVEPIAREALAATEDET